jgi:transcriptional regulator with XRE-family HTH domain
LWPYFNTFGIIAATMSLSDTAQFRAARSMAGLTQAELAERSGVSLPTVKRLELGDDGALRIRLDTLQKLQRALEAAGVEFTNGDQPGVRLAKRKGKAKR